MKKIRIEREYGLTRNSVPLCSNVYNHPTITPLEKMLCSYFLFLQDKYLTENKFPTLADFSAFTNIHPKLIQQSFNALVGNGFVKVNKNAFGDLKYMFTSSYLKTGFSDRKHHHRDFAIWDYDRERIRLNDFDDVKNERELWVPYDKELILKEFPIENRHIIYPKQVSNAPFQIIHSRDLSIHAKILYCLLNFHWRQELMQDKLLISIDSTDYKNAFLELTEKEYLTVDVKDKITVFNITNKPQRIEEGGNNER